jgi:hypothetical protein
LRQTLAVAQVNEDHATMVAAAMRPAAQANGLVEQGGVQVSAVMSSHVSSVK